MSEDRPQPKYKIGQVVVMKGMRKQQPFRVLSLAWNLNEWFYRWDSRNFAAEHMLRELTDEEIGRDPNPIAR